MQGRNTSERWIGCRSKTRRGEKKTLASWQLITTRKWHKTRALGFDMEPFHSAGSVSMCMWKAAVLHWDHREEVRRCSQREIPSYGSDQGKTLSVSPHRLPPDPPDLKHKCARTLQTNSYTPRNSFTESWSYTAMVWVWEESLYLSPGEWGLKWI